jgi:phage-related protein
MASIADVYITVLPETSKIADGIKAAFRAADKDAREAGARWGREIEQGIGKPKVELQADTAKAIAEIDEAARDRRSTIHVDVDKSGIDSLAASMGGLGGAGGGAGGGISAMGAGIAGLVPVASALSGVLALLPAGIAGAGAAVGTLATGLHGVSDAYTAVGDASKSANADQAAKAREVTSATRELQSAVRSEASAQQDVANARKEARQQLDDLNLSLSGGKIDEAQAYNNVLKARRDLATGQFKDQLDYNDAVLRVDSAQQTYSETLQRNKELQAKANDEQAKGVDGADNVVAANNRLQSSQEQVVAAQEKATLAMNSNSSAQQKAIDAMAALSPNAQVFINTLNAIKPAWQALQNTVQNNLFAGVGKEIQDLAGTYMPMLQSVMGSMATTLNQTFGRIATLLQSPQMVASMQTMFANLSTAFQAFMPAIPALVQGFGKLAEVGSSFLPQLGTAFAQAAQGFTQFISQAAASGQLQQWISTGIQAMSMLGNITQTVFKAFLDLGPLGTAIISALDQTLTALAPAIPPLATAFTALVTALTPILPLVANLIAKVVSALSPALTQWFNAMAPVITQLASALTPVINAVAPVLGQLAMIISDQMVAGIKQILPVLVPFVAQLGQTLVAVLPLLPQLMRLALTALPLIFEAIKTLLPFMTKWAEVTTNMATTVLPPLTAAATALADAFTKGWPIIKNVIHEVWDDVKPILDAMKDALNLVTDPINTLFGDDPKGGGAVPKGPGKGGAALPGPGQFVNPAAPGGPSGTVSWAPHADWDKVAGAEAGGNWGNKSNPKYQGGLQFDPNTWAKVKPPGAPDNAADATREQQIAGAEALLKTGANPATQWPATFKAHPEFFQPPGAASGAPAVDPAASGMPAMPATVALPASATGTVAGLPDAMGAHPQIAYLAALANQFGVKLTAGVENHSTDHGYHPKGEAGDFGNGDKTPEETAFANYLAQNFGPMIAELIHTGPGTLTNIKDGKNTPVIDQPGSIYNTGQAGYHGDHDHVAITDQMAPQFIAAAQQALGGAAPTTGAITATSGTSAPNGTPQAPFYMAPAPSQVGGQNGQDSAGQLGKDVGGDLWEMFGLPGMKNPAEFGAMKFFTGLLGGVLGMDLSGKGNGGKSAQYYANGGGTADGGAGGGGGGGLGSLFTGLLGGALGTPLAQGPGILPQMPGAPGGNSANIADMAQFKPPGGANSPGPGNTPGPVFDLRGSNLGVDPAGFQQTVTDMTTSQNRWAPLAQNLPH